MKLRAVLLCLCLPLWAAGCSPSYIPAPVVNLETAAPDPDPAPKPKPKPQPVREPEPEPRPEFYTVRSGDTLAAIALNFGLSHRDIALWNGIANPNVVNVGRRLRLEPPAAQPVATPLGGKKERLGLVESSAPESEEVGLIEANAPVTGLENATGQTVLQPRTTIAGREVASIGGGLTGAGGSVKTGPLAESFTYSAAKLRDLRAQWDARRNPDVAVVNRKPPPTGGAATGSGARNADSPQAARRVFGVEWGWPARGDLLSGFSDSSRGWDIGGKAGDPIYAAADGKVIYAGSGIKGFGRLVIVKHSNDYLSAYAHNRRILMKEGAQVRRGDLIAEMGDSGAERMKLHFEIRKGGKPTDPAEFLPERP